jgi:hypothetical protein
MKTSGAGARQPTHNEKGAAKDIWRARAFD